MKKPVLLFVVLLIVGTCFGQNLKSTREYLSVRGGPKKYYSTSSMKRFALENTSKSNQFKDILLSKTGESDINSVFAKVRIVKNKELVAGSYLNSGWNVFTQEIESFPGKYYKGDVTVYEDGDQEIILYKNECGNVLDFEGYDNSRQYKQTAKTERSYEPDFRSEPRSELRKPVQPKEDWSFSTPKNVSEDKVNLYLPKTTEEPYSPPKTSIGAGWFIVPAAIIGAGILTYFILKNNLRKSSPPPEETGGHGIDPPPPDPGGGGVDPPPP